MHCFFIDMTVCDQHHTIIRVQPAGEPGWVEFRGDGYQQWTEGLWSPAQRLHDCLIGPHASVLHAGSVLLVHEKHPDYPEVKFLMEGS